jgi:hypothetical protein
MLQGNAALRAVNVQPSAAVRQHTSGPRQVMVAKVFTKQERACPGLADGFAVCQVDASWKTSH